MAEKHSTKAAAKRAKGTKPKSLRDLGKIAGWTEPVARQQMRTTQAALT
jgi:hypothetical protein